jgi:hypothetical protein
MCGDDEMENISYGEQHQKETIEPIFKAILMSFTSTKREKQYTRKNPARELLSGTRKTEKQLHGFTLFTLFTLYSFFLVFQFLILPMMIKKEFSGEEEEKKR